MGVVCALVSCTIAYADGPVKEGNAIVGHVIEKGSEAGLPYATVLLVETGEGPGRMPEDISVLKSCRQENIP